MTIVKVPFTIWGVTTTLGRRLTEILRDKGWTQAELARRVGVTRACISGICRGADPTLGTLRRIAIELRVSESSLLDDSLLDLRG